MKLKRVLVEDVLNEDDELELEQPEKDLAAEIQDTAAKIGDEISDETAEEIADLAQDAGEKIGAAEVFIDDEDAPLEIKNRLTRALDNALEANISFREDGIKEVANVLVSGLPGSSKTATVYNWAARTTVSGQQAKRYADEDAENADPDKIHITYLNAKNNDIEAFINGYTVQDPDDKLFVRQAVSRNLDGLDRPNSVLFLDEYNRQTKDNVRASLLTLINEHYVTGAESNGKHYFKNFLFTIAAINPAGSIEDEGAAMLNDAERTRFLYKVKNFDSDPAVTRDYLKTFYVAKAAKEAKKATPNWGKIERFLRIWDLGTFICNHDMFAYDDKTKLNKLYLNQATMLNQRSLTAALAASKGNPDKLKEYITESSDFLDDDIKMLISIIDDYISRGILSLQDLLKKAGISESPVSPEAEEDDFDDVDSDDDLYVEKPNPEDELDAEDEGDDEDLEDDDDFFTGGATTTSGKTILSPSEAEAKITSKINSWKV